VLGLKVYVQWEHTIHSQPNLNAYPAVLVFTVTKRECQMKLMTALRANTAYKAEVSQ